LFGVGFVEESLSEIKRIKETTRFQAQKKLEKLSKFKTFRMALNRKKKPLKGKPKFLSLHCPSQACPGPKALYRKLLQLEEFVQRRTLEF